MVRLSMLILALAIVSPLAAQVSKENQKTSGCPTISVLGPESSYPVTPKEFKVEIKGVVPRDIEFVWSVSSGVIVIGQGTKEIRVELRPEDDSNVTATVVVRGLPKGCDDEDSAMAPAFCGSPILVDEFSVPVSKLAIDRFASAVEELKKRHPETKLYVIEYFSGNTSKFDIREKVRRLSAYLTKELKLDEALFEIDTALSIDSDPRTKVFLIPPGAEKPAP